MHHRSDTRRHVWTAIGSMPPTSSMNRSTPQHRHSKATAAVMAGGSNVHGAPSHNSSPPRSSSQMQDAGSAQGAGPAHRVTGAGPPVDSKARMVNTAQPASDQAVGNHSKAPHDNSKSAHHQLQPSSSAAKITTKEALDLYRRLI